MAECIARRDGIPAIVRLDANPVGSLGTWWWKVNKAIDSCPN